MTERVFGTGIRIRDAVVDDLPAVRQVLVETWHDTYDSLIGRAKVEELTGRWHAVPVLAQQLGQADTSFLVAEHGGQIVGHAFATARQRPIIQLARLYVLPAHQRRGFGSQLLSTLETRLPGANRICLNVEAENAQAVNFYRSRGFLVVGQNAVDGVDCLQMERAKR